MESLVKKKCKCVCEFEDVCFALVFLPCLLLSHGLNWGPERPINGEPVGPFGMENMRRPHIMFSSQPVLPAHPPTTSSSTHRSSSKAVRLEELTGLCMAYRPLHTSLLERGEFPLQPASFVSHSACRSQMRIRQWVEEEDRQGTGKQMLGSPLIPTSLKPNKNRGSFISFPAKP